MRPPRRPHGRSRRTRYSEPVIDREDLGSWMQGAPTAPEHVPGSSYGLPAAGPGSVAPMGLRLGSYAIDWLLCAGLSMLLRDGSPALVWPLWAAMNIVLLTLFGATAGQFVMRLRVVPVARRWPMVARALVRTVLVMLLLPVLVINRDRQGLQDVASGTAVVRA